MGTWRILGITSQRLCLMSRDITITKVIKFDDESLEALAELKPLIAAVEEVMREIQEFLLGIHTHLRYEKVEQYLIVESDYEVIPGRNDKHDS